MDFYESAKREISTRIDYIIKEIEKIRKDEDFSQEIQGYLENLSLSVVNLEKKITDFVDIYGFVTGAKSLNFDNINIIDLIKLVKKKISHSARNRRVILSIFYPDDKNITVKGDREYLRRTLEEILLKAVETSQEKSVLTINTTLKNNYIQIGITGKGIQDNLDFDVISLKRFVELHMGKLAIKQGEDQNRIYILLPLSGKVDRPVDLSDKNLIVKMVNKEEELPSLSPIAMKIVSMVSREETTVKQISDIVKNDPSLTARILKIANSSLYSFRMKISTLTQAISLLGMSAVRNIALCVSVLDSFPNAREGGFDYRKFWEFSLYSGLLCKLTAQRVNRKLEEEAFLAGLLQNIGSLIFAKYFPYRYSEIIEKSIKNDNELTELEVKEWGIDHPKVGSILMKKWYLPEILSSTILYHHKPEKIQTDDLGFSELQWLVYLSDRMIRFLNTGDSELIERTKQQYYELFKIKASEMDGIISKVSSEIKEIAVDFDIDIKEDINYAEILQRANIELGRINLSIEQANRELKKVISEKIELAEKLKEANQKLEQQAITDGLTGIFNHRFFYEILNKEFAESKRHDYPLSCIMADIDYFKFFNDTFGHKAGDEVLSKVASVIEKSIRQEDTVARYGGEEFSVLLPRSDGQVAKIVAERIRKNIENVSFYKKLPKGEVTISLGVATYTKDKNWDSENVLVEESDKALYEAKKNGRNRVEVR